MCPAARRHRAQSLLKLLKERPSAAQANAKRVWFRSSSSAFSASSWAVWPALGGLASSRVAWPGRAAAGALANSWAVWPAPGPVGARLLGGKGTQPLRRTRLKEA